jgi:hypothetical protein
VLSVYQGERLVATNAGWAGLERSSLEPLRDAFDRAGAFRLTDEGSLDAALIVTLAPGAYTAQVKSGDGSSGSTLLEVYELP